MSTQQYREVSRKANVGERVRVFGHSCPDQNREHTVTHVETYGHISYEGGGRRLGGYVVLEPAESAFPELLALFIRENAATVRKYLDEVAPALAIDSDGNTRATGVIVTKPLSRAEVIAKARADVAELLRIGRDINGRLPEGTALHHTFFTAEFQVNREKRAVTALVSTTGFGGKVNRRDVAKATAKASPDDVFHAEIGKAISLRRVLGLSVPDEYINAPKPDKPRVGAVVYWHSTFYGKDVRTTLIRRVPKYDGTRFGNFAFCHTAEIGWLADNQYTVIDDTDVDYGTDERSAAA